MIDSGTPEKTGTAEFSTEPGTGSQSIPNPGKAALRSDPNLENIPTPGKDSADSGRDRVKPECRYNPAVTGLSRRIASHIFPKRHPARFDPATPNDGKNASAAGTFSCFYGRNFPLKRHSPYHAFFVHKKASCRKGEVSGIR